LQDPLLPAVRAGRLGGGLGDLPPAQAAVLAADDADRAPQPAQSRCFLPIVAALVTRAASTGPGPGLPLADQAQGAAAKPS